MLNQYKSAQNRIFEMIGASHGGENRSFPTSLLFDDQGLSSLANNEFYLISVNGQPYDGKPLAPPVTAIFKLKKGGLSIEKSFSFEKDNFVVNLSAVSQMDGKPIGGKFYLGNDIGPEQEHMSSSTKLEVAYYSGRQGETRGSAKR